MRPCIFLYKQAKYSNRKARNQDWINSSAAAWSSIITNPFCSTQWLTHSKIPEGAEKLFIHSLLNDIASSSPRRLILGPLCVSHPQNYSLFLLKQNNTISHKLWGLIALNQRRLGWLYRVAEPNISVLKIQSGDASLKEKARKRERWWGVIGLIVSPKLSQV